MYVNDLLAGKVVSLFLFYPPPVTGIIAPHLNSKPKGFGSACEGARLWIMITISHHLHGSAVHWIYKSY